MPTLRELFDKAAQGAKENFEKHGTVMPVWIVETKDGDILPIGVPMAGKDEKEAMGAGLRELFKQMEAVRVVSVLEAWALMPVKELPESVRLGASISTHPDRLEIIMISAESKTEKSIMGEYKILRPEHGKAKLSPLKIHDELQRSEGIFANMLEAE